MRLRWCPLLGAYKVLRFASRKLFVVIAFLLQFVHRVRFLAPSLRLIHHRLDFFQYYLLLLLPGRSDCYNSSARNANSADWCQAAFCVVAGFCCNCSLGCMQRAVRIARKSHKQA